MLIRQMIGLTIGGLLFASSCAPPEPTNRVAVGDKAPPFRLKDQSGKEHSLEDLLKKGNAALVFYRSADW